MPVVTMPLKETKSHKLLSATLRELSRLLSSFSNLGSPRVELSEQECAALAVAAINGRAEAEFTVASVFDAAGYTARAAEWYRRAASRDYLPAMLQLTALR